MSNSPGHNFEIEDAQAFSECTEERTRLLQVCQDTLDSIGVDGVSPLAWSIMNTVPIDLLRSYASLDPAALETIIDENSKFQMTGGMPLRLGYNWTGHERQARRRREMMMV